MPMDIQSLLILLIVGAIAGWLAGIIVKGYGFGLIGNIVVGDRRRVHRQLAVSVARPVDLPGLAGSILSATLGAVILLFVIGLIRRVA